MILTINDDKFKFNYIKKMIDIIKNRGCYLQLIF